ncbi:MAG: hypothetical protein KJ051_12615 [Thermoleophilia bacterium]|nr:hypothetical protein [Thermoleophilia bacterium]
MKVRERAIVAAVVGASAGALAFVGLSVGGGKTPRVVPPLTVDQLAVVKGEVVDFAAANGDSQPTNGVVVATTRKAINELVGPGTVVDSDQDVHVAVVDGEFTAHGVGPPGADEPTGPVLFVVYDATTGEVVDWGLLLARPDVSRLGEVQPLGL